MDSLAANQIKRSKNYGILLAEYILDLKEVHPFLKEVYPIAFDHIRNAYNATKHSYNSRLKSELIDHVQYAAGRGLHGTEFDHTVNCVDEYTLWKRAYAHCKAADPQKNRQTMCQASVGLLKDKLDRCIQGV
jgi:hypothetical protein